MPLLGAIGNASEYSFRGTYDNYPLNIDFGNLIEADPGQIYLTPLRQVGGINYKVPVSISGDGEYYVGSISFDKTFDNNTITFDQTSITFDSAFPELDYSTLPTYVRNGDYIALRVIGAPPGTAITPEYYGRTYGTAITIGKEEFTWSIQTKRATPEENLVFQNRTKVGYSTEVISDTYVVRELSEFFVYNAEILTTQGLLSVNDGSYVRSSVIENGDTIKLKLTSSASNFTETSTTLRIALADDPTVGSATTTWKITTLDSIPSNLSFADVIDADLGSQILSNIITIEGISEDIDFNISIESVEGLLSVNGRDFTISTTIRNGDRLQLRVNTSIIWLEEKTVIVKLANTSTSWNVVNRTIDVNFDPNAENLIYAVPFTTLTEVNDMSPEVRIKSSLDAGLRSQSQIDTNYSNYPDISTDQSKFYGEIGSLKLAKGTTTDTSETGFVRIDTDQTQILGFSDFTIELWMRFSSFNFSGESGMSIFYPSYVDSLNLSDYFFQLFVKGDNYPRLSRFRRGILLGYPDVNGNIVTICETNVQSLTLNSWNHIALTRSGNDFSIWINGVLRASGTRSMDLTSTGYNFALPNLQRLIQDDVNIQDLRLYKGIEKYTSNFNINTVSPIMESIQTQVAWAVTRDSNLDNTIIFALESGNGPDTITWGPQAEIIYTDIQPGSVYILQNTTGTLRLVGNTLQLEDGTDNDFNDITVTPDKGTFTSIDRYVL